MDDTVVEIPIPSRLHVQAGGRTVGSLSWGVTDRLLLGPENHLARTAIDFLLDPAESATRRVVFVGPPECGKSYLAFGLAALWRQRAGARSAVAVSAREFARELSDAIDSQTTDDFHNRFRRVRFLAIDDLEDLAPRTVAQQELVCTLDALDDGGGRVVLTSRLAPQGISGLLPRLKSRLVASLIVPLALPSTATRLAAIRGAAALGGLSLSDNVAALLAHGVGGSLGRTGRVLAGLAAVVAAEGGPLTTQRVERYLAEQAVDGCPSVREIAAATARRFSLKLAELRSASRRRSVVLARHVAMYLARQLTPNSYEQIGRYFSRRDHSTVAHACIRAQQVLQNDPAIRRAVDQLQEQLQVGGPSGHGKDGG